MSAAAPTTTHKGNPVAYLIIGAIVLLFVAVATLLQIQTSEAFILHTPNAALVPNWNLINQVPNYLQGHLGASIGKAVFFAWGIELIYVICVVFHEVARSAMKGTHPLLSKFFVAVPLGVLGFQF